MRLRFLPLLILLAAALFAPATASAQPASGGHAVAAKKAKACKKRKGETKKHWLKRCKCKAFKKGESRKKFKKRCPGAKVPKRKAPAGGGTQPPPAPPGAPPAASGPLSGQAAIDYVNAAIKGMRISRQGCSGQACERSTTEFVDFCQDGSTFNGRTTFDNAIGGTYESVYSGTFKVLEAAVNAERTGAQARVNLTLTQASGNDDPPQSGDRLMTLAGSNLVYMGETEYTRGTAQC